MTTSDKTTGYSTGLPAVAVAVIACVAALGAAPRGQAAEYTMVIPHLLPEDLTNNEVQPALVHFESLVEARTAGGIEVELFGGGQLGSEVENGKEARIGKTVQAAVMSSGAMSSFFKEYQIITTPFLFPELPGGAGLLRRSLARKLHAGRHRIFRASLPRHVRRRGRVRRLHQQQTANRAPWMTSRDCAFASKRTRPTSRP